MIHREYIREEDEKLWLDMVEEYQGPKDLKNFERWVAKYNAPYSEKNKALREFEYRLNFEKSLSGLDEAINNKITEADEDVSEQYPQIDMTKKTWEGIQALIKSRINRKWSGLPYNKREDMFPSAVDAVIKNLSRDLKTDYQGNKIYGKDINNIDWPSLRTWVYNVTDYATNDYYINNIKATNARGAYAKDTFEKDILGKIKDPEDKEFFKSMYVWDKDKNQYISLPGGVGASNKERLEDILRKLGFGGEIGAHRRPTVELSPEIEPYHAGESGAFTQASNVSYTDKLERAFKKLDRKDGTDEDGLTDGEIALWELLADLTPGEWVNWDGALDVLNGNEKLNMKADEMLRKKITGKEETTNKNTIKNIYDKIKKIITYPDNFEYLKQSGVF